VATQRTTFDKLQRERAKKAKASAKRERRLAGKSEEDVNEAPAPSGDTAADLLERIERLHAQFDAKQITFEDFEERKVELFERLAALPIE
jgi:hypothetical protein